MVWQSLFGDSEDLSAEIDFRGTVTLSEHRIEYIGRSRRPPQPWHIVTIGLKPTVPAHNGRPLISIEYDAPYLRGLPKRTDTIAGTGYWTENQTIAPTNLRILETDELVTSSTNPITYDTSMPVIKLRAQAKDVVHRIESIQSGLFPATQLHVVTFRLSAASIDGHSAPFITIEYTGTHLRGIPRNNEDLIVSGSMTPYNTLHPTSIISQLTGEHFTTILDRS